MAQEEDVSVAQWFKHRRFRGNSPSETTRRSGRALGWNDAAMVVPV
jgi:hypothetical protein